VSDTRVIRVEALNENDFSAFGTAVVVMPGSPPGTSGTGWECWYPIGEMSGGVQIGIVESDPAARAITAMERHTGRPECVIALGAPVIQVVAPATTSDRPAADQARAFVIEPAQAVVIAPGTWHAAAAPLSGTTVRYIFLLGRPAPTEAPGTWTRFAGEETLHIQRA